MSEFFLGCNYWASNAGTDMWRDWSEEAIREDFDILTEHKITHLRVFINWRDFQPVIPMMRGGGYIAEYYLEGEKKPQNPYGLDEVMMERFGRFCDICEEYGLKLIVGLITGWMSGRTFIPPALYGKNLCNDPIAISFELKLVKGVVQRFKDKKAIMAWDLGNECNCMIPAENRYAAYSWTGMIANAIRANDPSRPVVSGMHSIKAADKDQTWTIEDQSEFCDVLTTHPYPLWVEHASKDMIISFRTLNHASCETKYYSDLGNKPCLVEEIGTMGPMICNEEKAAQFLRVNLLANWVHKAEGVMWWCANEQTNLDSQPYTRNMCETELGMINANREPKPVLKAMKQFAHDKKLWNIELSKPREDAVCILTEGQDHWGTAYMSWCLAKQISMNLHFCYANKEIDKAPVYMMPSLRGTTAMPKELYQDLKQRIKDGAVLYISNANGFLSGFEDLTGLRVEDSCQFSQQRNALLDGKKIPFTRNQFYKLKAVDAEVLSYDDEGDIAVAVHKYGKGLVYYVNFPLESMLLNENDAFAPSKNRAQIYKTVFADALSEREAKIDNPNLALTFHQQEDEKLYLAIINYSGEKQVTNLEIKAGYRVSEVITGSTDEVEPFDISIIALEKCD